MAHQGIDSTQVRALVEITAMACQRKGINIVGTAMLPCNQVLDVMHEFYCCGEGGNARIALQPSHGRTAGFRHPSLTRSLV
jgi:hypothetical protein